MIILIAAVTIIIFISITFISFILFLLRSILFFSVEMETMMAINFLAHLVGESTKVFSLPGEQLLNNEARPSGMALEISLTELLFFTMSDIRVLGMRREHGEREVCVT